MTQRVLSLFMKNLILVILALGFSTLAHASVTSFSACMEDVSLSNDKGTLSYMTGMGPQGADSNPITATGIIRDFLILAADGGQRANQLGNTPDGKLWYPNGVPQHFVCLYGTVNNAGVFNVTRVQLDPPKTQ
jgi:hypothetical protein